ncbi:hypothetical protein WA026_018253 [Henosepilachna vigintioctopunctata]|uniref:Uncharacterized protein n=1 Tax=Henosepilachna vigintioctopunctata TaxID=420089 RepID=A0AAW1V9M7_9CUCU
MPKDNSENKKYHQKYTKALEADPQLKGANPNIADADGHSPLHTLASQPETDKTRIFALLLVEYKANVNSTNNFEETPLYMAID